MTKKIKIILSAFLIGVLIIVIVLYNLLFGDSVKPVNGTAVIYIPEDVSYSRVLDSVTKVLDIRNRKSFEWLASLKNYPSHIKPGRYVIDRKTSYNNLINLLRSGRQSPVRLTFSNVRTINDIAGRIGGVIEADSSAIINFFSDSSNYSQDGFKSYNIISVFIPDTYEVYWNSSPQKLYSRMLYEYKRFWNKDRRAKSESIGLTQVQVSTLASIVDEEALKDDEKPRIAGVYLNRLRTGMPLQADPTIKFAIHDFTVNRILFKHLETDSPYNTYKYAGLPPGPIGCPSTSGIDAVLNAEKHNYLFFAARSDFSGYHNFSTTLSEHNRNARQYQRELNKRRIFR